MIYLTKNEVIFLHDLIISKTGGITGLKSEELLDSALNLPFSTFDGADLYPSDFKKIVRFTFSLVNNHPFIDGNKRIGALCMNILFKLNNLKVSITNEELIDIFLKLAAGEFTYTDFLNRINKAK